MKLIDEVKATLKCPETEGPFELYVTRTPGYLWACFFNWLGVHPVAVTLMSIAIGAASGVFLYSTDLKTNLIGMALLIWANWYDCADGQLARMADKRTLIGRILDGFCGDVWFFSIYFFLCLRMHNQYIPFTNTQWGIWIWLLSAWAGFRCHARQCAIGDYYRNIHMFFLQGKDKAELDSSAKVRSEMKAMKWMSRDWFKKLYLFFYASYCDGQEAQVKEFHKMMHRLEEKYGDDIPMEVRQEFCKGSKPLMPLTNIMNFDTRVAVMFISVGFNVPWVYIMFEVIVLEILRFYVINRHERLCREMEICK